MKRVSPLCLIIALAGLSSAVGQMPIPTMHPHSFSLQVVPVSTGSTAQSAVNTQGRKGTFGGRERQYKGTTRTETTERSAAIEISVHNFDTAPDSAQVEWYFVAEPAHPSTSQPAASQRFIFDKGSQTVSLATNGEAKIPVTSRSVTAETVRQSGGRSARYPAKPGKSDERRPTPAPADRGDKLSGWIVRVVTDGRVLECKGSKQELEDAGKDSARLASMAAKN